MRSAQLLAPLASLALVSCQQQAAGERQEQAPQQEAEQAADVPKKGVDRSQAGKAMPDVTFTDPDGGEISMADLRGVPVLINLWATWCAPCVKELPTLDALAERHAIDGQLGVVTVSQDVGPQASVRAFLEKLKVDDIGAFHDPKMALSGALGVQVMPTTIYYDASGKEVWRYVGDLDWSGSEAARLLGEAGGSQAR